MRIFGFCLVRDEQDLVQLSVLHHLRTGVDHVLLVDNGSSDGTQEIVEELGRDSRITAWRDDSEFKQGELFTEFAREAGRLGADWVVPFDADEFWVTPGTNLRTLLADTAAGALEAPVVNFVQARSQRDTTPDSLLSMTRRVERPVGPFQRTRELVESRQIAFVEMMYPPKFVSRVTSELEIGPGNHVVGGLAAPPRQTDVLRCLHAPLRSWAALESKAKRGLRMDAAGWPPDHGWHARRFGRVFAEGSAEAEWRANTYDEAGRLDVFGSARDTVVDQSLHKVVAAVGGDERPRPVIRRWLTRLTGDRV